MIETTHIWQYHAREPALYKKYGSKRSGTIFIVADSPDEAEQVVRDMYAAAGLTASKHISIGQSHLVKQALRLIL